MSVYNKTAIIRYRLLGSTAGLKNFLTFPNDFLVKRIWTVVLDAGLGATYRIDLTNQANNDTYASLAVGTSIAGTVVSADVVEADRVFAGGTVVALRDVNNSTNAANDVYVLVAHAE